MRRSIVAGNWKMHGSREAVAGFCEALRCARLGAELEVLVFPPVAYLGQFADGVRDTGVEAGAQDLHPAAQGAHTGGVSGAMIAELGGRWALTGHSERRSEHGESDALVAAKFGAALAAGLRPILCVGETLAERQAGEAEAVVARQVQAVIEAVGVDGVAQGAVAYEPVWAIGTGETATPDQAAAMHRLVRETIAAADGALAESIRVIYGGSVNPHNAAALFSEPDIDGGLIGGASLQAESFLAIVAAAV
ncbi:MAG: triose-phosphate isomerase [Gammaproteobacteria bacterium]|nr:triose-phosphate isomerase [Gammaproteobacteria bacterium]MYK81947.1 triose-phosphate isomerase [Gammaproteobacteria bacterium]